MIKPDYNVEDIFAIDYNQLKQDGIKALLFDLDSTLMPSKSGIFSNEVLELLKKLEQDFKLAIVSNNKNSDYINKAQAQVNFRVYSHANKPNNKVILQCLSDYDVAPKNSVMIGDRPLTDILAGKFAKTKTILVDSITRKTEAKIVRFVRFLEKLTISK